MYREPFKFAGQELKIKPEANEIGGRTIRVEDWWQNVSGMSWMNANGIPTAMIYAMRTALSWNIPIPIDDEVVYGKIDGLGYLVHVCELELPDEEDQKQIAIYDSNTKQIVRTREEAVRKEIDNIDSRLSSDKHASLDDFLRL